MIKFVDCGKYWVTPEPGYPIMQKSHQGWQDHINQMVGSGKGIVVNVTQEPVYLNDLWEEIRAERGIRLTKCDWTQFSDVQLANKKDWENYRQALRELPQKYKDDPTKVEWPVPPAN